MVQVQQEDTGGGDVGRLGAWTAAASGYAWRRTTYFLLTAEVWHAFGSRGLVKHPLDRAALARTFSSVCMYVARRDVRYDVWSAHVYVRACVCLSMCVCVCRWRVTDVSRVCGVRTCRACLWTVLPFVVACTALRVATSTAVYI